MPKELDSRFRGKMIFQIVSKDNLENSRQRRKYRQREWHVQRHRLIQPET